MLCEGKKPAGSLNAVRAVLRLTQLRCWVVPGRDSSSSAGSVRRVPSLHSAVRLRRVITCLLFLQALCLFRLVRGPRCAAVRARLQSHKAFRAGRTQPSASAPGCWRRQCQSSQICSPAFASAQLLRCLPQTARFRPHQGCSRLPLIQRHCQGANHRRTPLQPPCLAPTGWAVPSQAPEGVCPPIAPVSSAVPGSLASPFRGAPEPAAPHAARHPPGPRSTSFRALWYWQTHSRHPQARIHTRQL